MRSNRYLDFLNNYEIAASKDMSYCNCGKPDQVEGFSCRQHCKHGKAEEDYEGGMAKFQLNKIANQANALKEALSDDTELPAWIQDKISKAEHHIEAAHDYIMYDKTEALQYGKPGPKDPRKTPAPKKDQKKGSKKNKPDSAKDDKSKITFSDKTIEKLKNKVSEHNAKDKGSKATLGMLKAVYRRGAGAFSTSHAPKMSRDGWAMARVNAFLYLLRNGKPSNPNYKQDNDLLPKGHPRSTK